MSLPIVILAGGLATRLQPLTANIPKILIDVAGRPFAEHQIDLVRRHGIRDIIYCIGHLGEQVEAALGDGSTWGVRIRYVSDGPVLCGTGGAVRRALPLVGSEFFVMYGDSYLPCDFSAVAQAYRESGRPALMTVYKNDDRFDHSNVEFTRGVIVRYDKQHRDDAMRHIDYGLGVLRAGVFQRYADEKVLDLATVYQHLVAEGQLAGFEVHERFYEIGSIDGLTETRALLSGTARKL